MDPAQPDTPRWRLPVRWQRWFDVGLASFLVLLVAATAATGAPITWSLLALGHLLPLYVRRRRPVAVFAAVAATSAVQALVIDSPTFSVVAFPIATYSIARFSRPRPAGLALLVGVVAAGVASYDWLRPYDRSLSVAVLLPYFLTITAIVVTSWALGTAGRTRQAYVDALVERGQRIEREAAQQVALAAIEERTRIAREMHDVVAHGLSVIVVQADGARYAADREPAVATRTLATIAETGRESLSEMRRLLGVLRAQETGSAPQPRLGDLDDLVEEARAAGTGVTATLPDDDAVVPAGAALTAYRVVQEALSNVRKHAGPDAVATVSVSVTAAGDEEGAGLEVLVEDDGRGASAADDGHGLGLVGMRERVGVHDGTLAVGPRPGGGYRVSARIPL